MRARSTKCVVNVINNSVHIRPVVYPSNPSLSIQVGMTVKSPVWQLFFVNKSTYKTDHLHFNAWYIGCLKSCKTDLHDADEEAIREGLHGVVQTEDKLNETGQL